MSIRAEKVASVVKRALSNPINEIARENSAGLATVTAVRLSKDLQIAKVYISLYGKNFSPMEFIDILGENKSELRYIVGQAVRLRNTPDLRFFIDDTLDQMDHIQKLLDSVKSDQKDNDE